MFQKLTKNRIATVSEGMPNQNARSLLIEAAEFLLLTFSGYLASFSGIFIIEHVCGLVVTAKYNAISRVGLILCAVCGVIPQMIYPLLARAYSEKNFSECNKLRNMNMIATFGLYLISAGSLYTISPWLMRWWLGSNNYLGGITFGAILIYGALYVFNTALATPAIAALGAKKFIPQAIANCVCVPLFSYYLGLSYGVNGVIWGMTLGIFLPTMWIYFYTRNLFKPGAEIK
jgi:O-antigen/teichoic acid export membrane protein